LALLVRVNARKINTINDEEATHKPKVEGLNPSSATNNKGFNLKPLSVTSAGAFYWGKLLKLWLGSVLSISRGEQLNPE
jgi:hypothetical protein